MFARIIKENNEASGDQGGSDRLPFVVASPVAQILIPTRAGAHLLLVIAVIGLRRHPTVLGHSRALKKLKFAFRNGDSTSWSLDP